MYDRYCYKVKYYCHVKVDFYSGEAKDIIGKIKILRKNGNNIT